MTDTKWELKVVADDIECVMDNSGIYVSINRIINTEHSKGYIGQRVSVRVDVMTDNDEPVMSFVGKADNVRKAVMAFLDCGDRAVFAAHPISREHASYIGSEIARAENNEHYKQS